MSCTFCNFSNIKDRTIATVDDFHIVVSRGQITDGGYLLLIPIKHTSCLGNLDKTRAHKLNELTQQLSLILETEYNSPVTCFEHGVVGQTIPHAHLHLFPARINLKSHVENDFPGLKIERVKDFSALQKAYHKTNQEYLLWTAPRNQKLVCWNPPAPPEYFPLLTARLLGVPERGSWKDIDHKLDHELTQKTMEKLYPILNP